MRRLTRTGLTWGLDAALLALLTLGALSAVAGCVHPGYRLAHLWIGGEALWVGLLFCAALGSWRSAAPATWHRVVLAALVILALRDVARFHGAVGSGSVRSALPIPLSAVVAVVLAWGCFRPPRPTRRRIDGVALLALAACAVPAWLGLHLATFGTTDYRRPANAAVVLGAAVRPDGAASTALRDRTLAACRLYHEGLVQHLVLSGGRDPRTPISEPACMARIALEAGVPRDALVLDESGATSRDTLDEVVRLTETHRWRKTLLVSHDYHLARLAMGAKRRGLRSYTVPAAESAVWIGKSMAIVREVAALMWYAATDV